MVKEEIVAGLKMALARGETLEKAMMSFFNSGYAKQDVEEAASSLNATSSPQIQKQATPSANQTPQSSPKENKSEIEKPELNIPQPIHPHPESESQVHYPMLDPSHSVQKVSGYGERPNPVSGLIIFILIFFLLVLIGVLIAAFLFKEELSGFFNSFL